MRAATRAMSFARAPTSRNSRWAPQYRSHGLDQGHVHIADIEASAFRYHAEHGFARSSPPVAEKPIEHDHDGGATGVASRVQVWKPLLIRHRRSAPLQHLIDPTSKVMRRVVTQQVVDSAEVEHALGDQPQSTVDAELDHVFQQPNVLPDEQ